MVRLGFCACSIAACAMGLSTQVRGDTIEFDGKTYVTIDWESSSAATDIAVGSVFGQTVTYNGAHVHGNKVFNDSYLGNEGYSALNFGTGSVDNIKIGGGVRGTSTIDFGQEVSDLIMLVGIPATHNKHKWGPSFWSFQGDVDVSVIGTERDPGLEAIPDKLLDNLGPKHITGAVRITGESFSTLSWLQNSPAGALDKMRITFAVEAIPAPGALALLGMAGVCQRRRRRA